MYPKLCMNLTQPHLSNTTATNGVGDLRRRQAKRRASLRLGCKFLQHLAGAVQEYHRFSSTQFACLSIT